MNESKVYAENVVGALLHAAETDAEYQAWKKQQEAPAKKKPMTPEERAKIIEEILDDLEFLGIIPPKKKGGDHE